MSSRRRSNPRLASFRAATPRSSRCSVTTARNSGAISSSGGSSSGVSGRSTRCGPSSSFVALAASLAARASSVFSSKLSSRSGAGQIAPDPRSPPAPALLRASAAAVRSSCSKYIASRRSSGRRVNVGIDVFVEAFASPESFGGPRRPVILNSARSAARTVRSASSAPVGILSSSSRNSSSALRRRSSSNAKRCGSAPEGPGPAGSNTRPSRVSGAYVPLAYDAYSATVRPAEALTGPSAAIALASRAPIRLSSSLRKPRTRLVCTASNFLPFSRIAPRRMRASLCSATLSASASRASMAAFKIASRSSCTRAISRSRSAHSASSHSSISRRRRGRAAVSDNGGRLASNARFARARSTRSTSAAPRGAPAS